MFLKSKILHLRLLRGKTREDEKSIVSHVKKARAHYWAWYNPVKKEVEQMVIKFDDSGLCSCIKLSSSSRQTDDHADENVSGTAALKLFLLYRIV